MKRIFILVLTLLLVVSCFSSCSKEQEFSYTNPKTQQTEVFIHNLGDFIDLDAGAYRGTIKAKNESYVGYLLISDNGGAKSFVIVDERGDRRSANMGLLKTSY